MDLFVAPEEDIAEVTLLGTGGGYGESIVIHIGKKKLGGCGFLQEPIYKRVSTA